VQVSTETKIRYGFGLAVGFLIIIAAASYLSEGKSARTFQSMSHTQRVLNDLEEVLLGMSDVETSSRGYVASGVETFLGPYESGTVKTKAALEKLRRELEKDPEQKSLLQAVEPLMGRKLEYCGELNELRRSQGLEIAARKMARAEGKRIMDQIRALIGKMEAVETQRLNQSTARAGNAARNTMLIVLFGALISVTTVGIAGFLVSRDFTERKRVEEERDRIWSLSRDLLGIATFGGYFKVVNPAWTAVLGLEPKEVTTHPFIDLVHPDDRERTTAEAGKLAEGKETIRFENRYRCKDGGYRWISWGARSVVEQGLIYAVGRDVTEERRAKDEVETLNADLEARAAQLATANKELEAFSYSVSHDLRAPLRHIDGYAARLVKVAGEKLDEKSRRYLQTISDAAKEMGQLIDDLLLFSRMGRMELQQGVVELSELTEGVIQTLGAETQSRKIRWTRGELPAIAGDGAMLKQVMINLLSNAVKYTRPRDVAEIEIGCTSQTEKEVVLFVKDNGVGFEMEYVNKLFGVFQRLHRVSEFEGTGIGLANVRRIVQRHGGRTWAEGAVDRGATFYFSIPKNKKE
jgi:PAS domain S-box-containing protein